MQCCYVLSNRSRHGGTLSVAQNARVVRIAVLGAGAIGTLVAACLATTCDVCLVVRDAETQRAIEAAGGVRIEGDVVHRVRSATLRDASPDIDVLIVAVKSFATEAALADLHGIPAAATVVSLQNGIDAAAQIERALGRRERIALAPTTEAATYVAPGLVRRTARGTTHLGWAIPRGELAPLASLAEVFTRSGLHAVAMPSIEPYVWGKLVANAAINPVTALAGVTNGAVLASDGLRMLAAALAREAAAVATSSGVVLPFADPVAEAERVMRVTAPNRSSMLQDLDRGRPTEIEAISGAIVRIAAMHGVAVPESARVLDEVRRRTKA